MSNICYSGGATGADYNFTMCALEAKHKVVNYSFEGHRIPVPQETVEILDQKELDSAIPFLVEAEEVLGKKMPNNPYTLKLMLRDYFQILNSERIYAVRDLGSNGLVLGGTGCTVTMGLLKGIKEVYLFAPSTGAWWQWAGSNVRDESERYWITVHKPKRPHGKYTGIGGHQLEMNSIKVIKDLYGK